MFSKKEFDINKIHPNDVNSYEQTFLYLEYNLKVALEKYNISFDKIKFCNVDSKNVIAVGYFSYCPFSVGDFYFNLAIEARCYRDNLSMDYQKEMGNTDIWRKLFDDKNIFMMINALSKNQKTFIAKNIDKFNLIDGVCYYISFETFIELMQNQI